MVRSVIVGTGAIAHAHAKAVAETDGIELAGVVDLSAERAAAFAEQWGDPAVFGSLTEALALRPDAARIDAAPIDAAPIDYVHICTPPGSHVDLAIEAQRAGAVPIVEKPPALSLEDFDRLLASEAETGVPVVGLFQHRFGSAAVGLRRLLAEGALGRPLVAVAETLWYRGDDYFAVPWRGTWGVEGGGPTMGHGIHQFDLLLSVLGPWSSVKAVAVRQNRPTETEDVSSAIVTFENGAVATILNSIVSPRETSRLRFDFEHATAELEHLYGYDSTHWRFTPARGSEALAERWTAEAGSIPSGHTAQLAAVLAARAAGSARPSPRRMRAAPSS
ncbi:Gfo/Idh/MocA family protein [Arenivirga flava]|uniref:Gfo/Idh/MocA family oxidoreductase n=1 Tax=Arenivirga flava TaxID=1930060 RepID=A0AA37X8X3_9MICO|nr:Gfo/Idh/MocA family oxidoreductase [Arenivirga flava]GMA27899.1 hypothetical protein GCM10025874_11520 [Arenivirga flava]